MPHLFFIAKTGIFSLSSSSFCLVTRGEPALLGMSLTTLEEVPRSVSRFSRVVVAIISDCFFVSPKFSQLRLSRSGKLNPGYVFESIC